jgi:hypothetical protein
VVCIEVRLHNDAEASAEANLDGSAVCRSRLRRRANAHNPHLDELVRRASLSRLFQARNCNAQSPCARQNAVTP